MQKPLELSDVSDLLPEICFWDSKSPSMEFVNPTDFHRDELLGDLGLKHHKLSYSFGVSDSVEIKKRQRIVKMFFDHPFIRQKALFLRLGGDIRMKQNDFLDQFPENVERSLFLEQAVSFAADVKKAYKDTPEFCPPEMVEFCNAIAGIQEQATAIENDFAKKVVTEITKSARITGSMVLKRGHEQYHNWRVESKSAVGYQKYSYLLTGWQKREMPKWTRKRICRWIGLSAIVGKFIDRQNRLQENHRYEAMVIEELPICIEDTIVDFVNDKLRNAPRPDENYQQLIEIYFIYGVEGLRIYLVDFALEENKEKKGKHVQPEIIEEYPGFSGKHTQIRQHMEKISKSAPKKHATLNLQTSFWAYMRRYKKYFLKGEPIASPEVDERYRWYSVEAVCETSCAKEYALVSAIRKQIAGYLEQIRSIAEVANKLAERSGDWGIDLTFPEILNENDHLIAFDSLLPIHLIGRKSDGDYLTAEKLIPLGKISLNGQTLGFTGQNAGGKTVTMETILNAIFMAQSGLPIFGSGFRLNPKKKVGLMFLERGSGSTFELQLRKAKYILEAMKNCSSNEMVNFLDEVGTGTQEIAGYEFGVKLLEAIAKHKSSLVFSTQIPALAQAATKAGAQCFKFDLEHNITAGIGQSGAEELIRKVGLESMLN